MSDCSDPVSNQRTPFQRSDLPRSLSEEEETKLSRQDSRTVTSFRAAQLEVNAQKYWDQFYNRNGTKFFKDRSWAIDEFHELVEIDGCNKSLFEVGCGVGNLFFPLVQKTKFSKYFACDFSPKAVEYVKNHQLYDYNKMYTFQADITKDSLKDKLNGELVDVVTMIFLLSAIHPSKFDCCAENVYDSLKPGGLLLFRDYAINDMTQIRFKPGNKISENFYCRQDGTFTYFMTIEELRRIFLKIGFVEEDCSYIHTKTINKKEGIDVPRTFLQAKFIKPK